MGIRIWLDDLRTPPPGVWHICRTAEEAIGLIEAGGVSFVAFDHDLGDGPGGNNRPLTGYDVALRIEQLAVAGKIGPVDYSIQSANPVGRDNIEAAMSSARRFWSR